MGLVGGDRELILPEGSYCASSANVFLHNKIISYSHHKEQVRKVTKVNNPITQTGCDMATSKYEHVTV